MSYAQPTSPPVGDGLLGDELLALWISGLGAANGSSLLQLGDRALAGSSFALVLFLVSTRLVEGNPSAAHGSLVRTSNLSSKRSVLTNGLAGTGPDHAQRCPRTGEFAPCRFAALSY